MKKAILFHIFFFSSFSFGQDAKTIDSLKTIISSKVPTEDKIESYKKLIEFYLINGSKESSKAIEDLNKLNKNNSCLKCKGLYYYYSSIKVNISGGGKSEVFKLLDKSIEISKLIDNDDDDLYYTAIYEKLDVLIGIKNFDEAEKLLASSEKYFKNHKNRLYANNINFQYANYFYKKGYYHLAIDKYLKVDQYYLKNKKDDIDSRIHILGEVAMLYLDLDNLKKASEYSNIALLLAKKSKSDMQILQIKYRKGIVELKSKNYLNSLKFFNEIYAKLENSENIVYKCATASFIARNYLLLKDYKKASYYSNISIKGFKNLNNFPYLSNSILTKARIEFANGDYISAKKNIDSCKIIMKDLKDTNEYLNIFDAEIDFYKVTGQYKELYYTYINRDSITKIFNDKTNQNSLNEIETTYQTEKKEQQIKLLSTQNELAQKQKYIYIALLGLLAIIGGSSFYGYRNKIKTAEKLNELNELKSRFFANISHEFRTPLTLIKSPMQSLQSEITDESQKSKLHLIDKNSNRMLELVDQLLELSKLDNGKLQLILKEGNIAAFLNSLADSFTFQAKENKLSFTSTIEKNAENHHFDKDVLEKIVTNLLSNAIKYTIENEKVSFDSKIENNQLQLVVSNSGSEIKKEELSKLFERFYQKKENQHGVGIGLALVKELVELYKGTIETNVENGILSFTVSIPLEKANENAIVVSKEAPKAIVFEENNSDTELPILLIVDDNQDIRMVLKDIFKNKYQILEAEDGEQALKIAKKEIPDCIISDVMMPKMDGFEFTKQIKNNELTSFIPVILLTAKTSDEAHLEALKSTADAYLTKPFNNEIVKETVSQLIAERKKLHLRYSKELVLRPVDIVINSVDEKFIAKLQVILDKELSNADFSSEDFAAAVGMSRMQLHRKLKSLLGVTSTEFLRNERLKIATKLLKDGNGNISDVAYAVGFNDVSYFSKCFKEMYGCTPSEYSERN